MVLVRGKTSIHGMKYRAKSALYHPILSQRGAVHLAYDKSTVRQLDHDRATLRELTRSKYVPVSSASPSLMLPTNHSFVALRQSYPDHGQDKGSRNFFVHMQYCYEQVYTTARVSIAHIHP